MKKLILAAMALFALASLASAIGDACTIPGQPSTCSGGSPPYSGDFCINFTRQDIGGAWVGQIACNCLKNTLGNSPTTCSGASDCCPTFGCDVNKRCGSLKILDEMCNPQTQNCESTLFCLSGGGATGVCKPKGDSGAPCTRNYACKSGLVCGLQGYCASPYTLGQDCVPVSSPEDEQCAGGLFCNMSKPGRQQQAKCADKRADGELCEQDKWCTSGRCWNPLGAHFEMKCIPTSIGKPNMGACYSHAECYSPDGCSAYGSCRQFILLPFDAQCKHDRECLTEKCAGGKCEFRDVGEECEDELQCRPELDCIRNFAKGTAVCDYIDAGSDPVVSRMPADLAGGNGYMFSVKVKNEGRDDTDNSMTLLLEFMGPDGSVVSSSSRTIPKPLASKAEYSTTDSFSCRGNGFYSYRASLTDVTPERLKLSILHSKERETATVPVQCGGCSRNNDWLPAALLALLAGFAIVAIMFMGAQMASSQGLKTHAFEELGALIVSAVLVGLLATSVIGVDEQLYKVACNLAGGPGACIQASEPRTLAYEVANRNNALARNVMDMSMGANQMISTEASKSAFCSMLGVGLSVGGCSSWGVARGPIVQTISAAGFASADSHSKIVLLSVACSAALTLFMPLGLVLRAFRFTRGAGSFIIGLSLALYMVFPLAIVAGDAVVNSFMQSGIAQNDAKLGKALQNVNSLGDAKSAPSVVPLILGADTMCDASNPKEDNLKRALLLADSPQISDAALLLVLLRGPFETLFAIALTLVAARAFAHALGTEIEVSQLARLS